MCGCSKTAANVSPQLNGITFDLKLNFYNEVFKCSGQFSADNVLTLTVSEPEIIKGMKLTVKDNALTAEYMGLTYTPKTEKLPFANLAQVFYETFSDVIYRNPDVKTNGESFFLESANGDKYYKITLTQTGYPISAEIPYCSLIGEFSNVSIIKSTP